MYVPSYLLQYPGWILVFFLQNDHLYRWYARDTFLKKGYAYIKAVQMKTKFKYGFWLLKRLYVKLTFTPLILTFYVKTIY